MSLQSLTDLISQGLGKKKPKSSRFCLSVLSSTLCQAVGLKRCIHTSLISTCRTRPHQALALLRPCFHDVTGTHQGHRPPCTSGRELVTLAITCGWAEKLLLVPRSPRGHRLYSGLAALRQIAVFIRSIVRGVGTTGPPARTGPLMRWRQQNVVKHVFGHVEVQPRLTLRHRVSVTLWPS